MSTGGECLPEPSGELNESIEVLGLKEMLNMMIEVGSSPEQMLAFIDNVLLDPIPAFETEEERIAFREKMFFLRDAAIRVGEIVDEQIQRDQEASRVLGRIDEKIEEIE